jgi:hypothetical protein
MTDMKRILALATIMLLPLVLVGFPPVAKAAPEVVTYTATAPTTGNTPTGYRWWWKLGNAPWAVVTVAGSDSTLTPTITVTIPENVPTQLWVQAYDRPASPRMSGDEMIGTTTVRRYGVQSPYSQPHTVTAPSVGGCGRPVRQ